MISVKLIWFDFDFTGSDPFCIIKCDGYKEHTNVVKKNTSPDWGERFTFYHKKPDKDIIVEVQYFTQTEQNIDVPSI